MARPRKGEEKDRPVHLGFRVSEETSRALRALAEKRSSPMSDLVVGILEKGLRDAGVLPLAETRARAPARKRNRRSARAA